MPIISTVNLDYTNEVRFPLANKATLTQLRDLAIYTMSTYGLYGCPYISLPKIPENYSHVWTDYRVRGGGKTIEGTFQTLNTPNGLILENWINNNYPLIGHVNLFYDPDYINNGLNGLRFIWSIDILRV